MTASIGGEGPYCVAVLWSLTALVFVFLVLRAYARIFSLATYGVDDHFYALSFILIVAYCSMIHVAVLHGYGRPLDLDGAAVDATYFRMVGQTFSLLAVGTSKASVGAFLLRLVFVRWQKIAVWAVILVMGGLSVLGAVFTWVACTPLAFSYDERIPGGRCFDTVPLSLMLALGTIVVDIFFAVLPWTFIWKLSAPRRERITISGSMSLGILAALAGAKRITEVHGVRDVPVGVIIWSQVETSLTLICVGISVCGPLWLSQAGRWIKTRRSGNYLRHQNGAGGESGPKQPVPIGLNTFGGGTMPGAAQGSGKSKKKIRGPNSLSLFTRLSTANRDDGSSRTAHDTQSDEENLTAVAPQKPPPVERKDSCGPDSSETEDPRTEQMKRSWILGEISSHSEAEGRNGQFDDTSDAIKTLKTYAVMRS
ncbi:hypothetical protein F4775DRAFT_588816 [Biscogniauxia sp. FL1348]|nr:hypothetical protein F4775DRAFT_588816 [Biscogniauxia sp. FL1348]